VSRITEIVVGGPAEPWVDLGLAVESGVAIVGEVALSIRPDAPAGILSIGLLDADSGTIDGAPIHGAEPVAPALPTAHRLGAVAFDHVVLVTSSLERTTSAVTSTTGLPLKRIREAGPVRQGFFRLGQVILEVVENSAASNDAGPTDAGPNDVATNDAAGWWGLVLNVTDLDTACALLGPERVGPARPAVQPGRSIATVRAEAGLGLPVALMSV
jgi:hypothetical protein